MFFVVRMPILHNDVTKVNKILHFGQRQKPRSDQNDRSRDRKFDSLAFCRVFLEHDNPPKQVHQQIELRQRVPHRIAQSTIRVNRPKTAVLPDHPQ